MADEYIHKRLASRLSSSVLNGIVAQDNLDMDILPEGAAAVDKDMAAHTEGHSLVDSVLAEDRHSGQGNPCMGYKGCTLRASVALDILDLVGVGMEPASCHLGSCQVVLLKK